MDINISNHIDALIAGGIGAIGVWWQNIANKKKYNAEANSLEIDNLAKSVELYKGLVDDLEKRFQKKHEENQVEIEGLKKKLDEVTEYWKKRYNDLKKDFEQYKQEHP